MTANLVPLLGAQWARLAQQHVGDGDVAHVVQQAREPHLLHRRFGQAQLTRRDLRQPRDRLRVPRGARITDVERIGERQNRRELLVAGAVAAVGRRQHADDLLAVDHSAVAAQLLGRVEGVVGGAEQLVARGAVLRKARHAEADRHLHGVVGELVARRLPQPLRQHERAVVHGVRHDQRELLAAEPGQGVDAALLPIEGVACARERAVTLVVPEPVVDLLEVVEVADHDAQLSPSAASPLELELECLLEAAPVQQPGERVGAGRVGQPAHGQVHVAPQGEDQHARDDQGADRQQPLLGRMVGPVGGGLQDERVATDRERHLRERREAAEEVAGEQDHPQVEEGVRGRRRAAEVDADGDQHRAQRRDPGVGRGSDARMTEQHEHRGAECDAGCGQHSGHVGLGMRKRGQRRERQHRNGRKQERDRPRHHGAVCEVVERAGCAMQSRRRSKESGGVLSQSQHPVCLPWLTVWTNPSARAPAMPPFSRCNA